MNNFVQLIGHLGNDPEKITLTSGKSLVKFSLATNSFGKEVDGERQKTTHWHAIVAWGNIAERMESLLKKGSKVILQGSLDQRTWQSDDGKTNKRTEIVARQFTLMSEKKTIVDMA